MSILLNEHTGRIVCNDLDCSSHWCQHLAEFISKGEDAQFYQPGIHILVPIFPTQDIFAEVQIDDETFPNGSALMKIFYTPDIGRDFVIPLGFWNPGEGSNAVRGVFLDWLKSQLHPDENFDPGPILTKCPAKIHGVRSERVMKLDALNVRWKMRCLFNIVMEKACTACFEDTLDPHGEGLGMIDVEDALNTPVWKRPGRNA